MADYWKSQPKKFCEACKCWFADNKASIDFHERGKNHQANVQKRITEIMKKGKKMHKAQQNYENIMDGINQAALQAYQKDVESGGSKLDKLRYEAEEAKLKERTTEKERENSLAATSQVITWFEAVTEGGDTYYWNMETGESSWEKPTSGYVPLSEQEEGGNDDGAPEEHKSGMGPMPKANPYGEWQEVRPKVTPQIDLQLPQKQDGVEEVVISVPNDVPTKVKFLEKTVGSLESEDDNGSSVFKKRKPGSHSRRNVRQRTDDE
uniref:Putative ww domain-binding protein 4 n=1 Tax=Amblyomma triste TaxID=251400 RepID=A0A023GEQ7_AMBTT